MPVISPTVTNEELEQLREIAFGVCKSDLEANAYRSAIEAAAREETTEEFEQVRVLLAMSLPTNTTQNNNFRLHRRMRPTR